MILVDERTIVMYFHIAVVIFTDSSDQLAVSQTLKNPMPVVRIFRAAGSSLIEPEKFPGLAHGRNFLMVQITCSEGRSVAKKKALYASINQRVAQHTDVRQEDVIINLVETKRENWSFGLGLAQYAT
jgi:phenylpyruvate tautomerase PptA (4-oxalocrotonate tautomerase family)